MDKKSHLRLEKNRGYQPSEWEDKLYQMWLDSGFFNPDVCEEKEKCDPTKPPFSMVLPPPNATGTLHTGSACMLAIEDMFARFARMQGRPTLWLPGTDHAAIATQSKVERILFQETGLTRNEIGREKLLKNIEEFVQKNQEVMIGQMKKMGASLDWSRLAFTLDQERSQAVRRAFKKMYDDGIIYRGNRIVNWDPKGQTTISDDEVVYKEETTKLYHFQYGPFVIATARPETKFGDKYVVMHPDDERFSQYTHGQKLELEWINGPLTATVIKDSIVDPEFGTGVMTITPWHSMADFEIAERHNLDKEPIIDLDGNLLPLAGEFSGLPIQEAREKIVEKLQSKGLVVKIEDEYIHQIATAERTGAVIEPQILKQWFIDVQKEFLRNDELTSLKKLMQEAVRSGQTKILPDRFEKTYFHWIDNLRDWCISRQLWYGHQIPVWYKGEEMYCGLEAPEGSGWTQDPDVLDTWFSSGLWTFSTLGWGSDDELWQKEKRFHPTTLIESGYDILFFWIARMIMMSTYFLEEVPFQTVYLHGLVRDEEGRKMSKSLDNIIDPVDVIQKFGTDALRLALVSGATPGNDVRLSDEKLTAMRNLINKIYNLGQYVSLQAASENAIVLKTPADHFIALQFEETKEQVGRHLSQYNLSLAIDALRDFTLNDFADWYVEIHKTEKNSPLLRHIFKDLLTLWHPFTPFVSEALRLEIFPDSELLLITPWPAKDVLLQADNEKARLFEDGRKLVSDIRRIRSIYNVPASSTLPLKFTRFDIFENGSLNSLLVLARIVTAGIQDEDDKSVTGYISVGKKELEAFLYIGEVVNIEVEKARLTKKFMEVSDYLTTINEKLENKNFVSNAPKNILSETQKIQKEKQEEIIQIQTAIDQLT